MKRIFFLFLLLVSTSAFSQEVSFGIRSGLGSYSMNMLDEFQKFRVSQALLPLKTTESYPVTPFYRGELALNNLKFIDKIGLFYAFYSTGARSTVSDYSGRADLDATINANQFGFTFQKAFFESGSWTYAVYADASYLFSVLKTTDLLDIVFPERINQKQKYRFISSGYAIEPGFAVSSVMKPFVLQVNLGLMVDFPHKLHLDGDKEMILGVNNNPVTPQWLGARLGIQVSYMLKKKMK